MEKNVYLIIPAEKVRELEEVLFYDTEEAAWLLKEIEECPAILASDKEVLALQAELC